MTESSKVSLGKRISSARKKANLTQVELAEKLNVTQQALAKWEADISFPRRKIIPNLLSFLDSVEDKKNQPESFLNGPDEIEGLSAIQAACVSMIISLLKKNKMSDGECIDLMSSWKEKL